MQLLVEPEAEADLAAACDWYDQLRSGLGDEFTKEFEFVARQILQFPNMWRIVQEDARQAALKRFPYYVFYVVDEDLVSVVAVIHKHRDPEVWQHRLT